MNRRSFLTPPVNRRRFLAASAATLAACMTARACRAAPRAYFVDDFLEAIGGARPGISVLFAGEFSTGKTYLACLLARHLSATMQGDILLRDGWEYEYCTIYLRSDGAYAAQVRAADSRWPQQTAPCDYDVVVHVERDGECFKWTLLKNRYGTGYVSRVLDREEGTSDVQAATCRVLEEQRALTFRHGSIDGRLNGLINSLPVKI